MTGWYKVSVNPKNCSDEIQDSVFITVHNCIEAVDDHIYVFTCESTTFDPTLNDYYYDTEADKNIVINTQGTKGTASLSDTDVTYTNNTCIRGNDMFTYTICNKEGDICSIGNMFVSILDIPEIMLLDSCSFHPQMTLSIQYPGIIQWQYSYDNTIWTDIPFTGFMCNKKDEGYYRVLIEYGNAKTITTVKKLEVLKETLLFNSTWYQIVLQ